MNTADAAPDAPATSSPRLTTNAFDAWRHITSDQVVGASILAVVAVLPRAFALLGAPVPGGRWLEVMISCIGSFVVAGCLLLAVVIADQKVDCGASRIRSYSLAVVTGTVAGCVLFWLWVMFASELPSTPSVLAAKVNAAPVRKYTMLVNMVFEWLIIGSLATYIYADRRETQKIQARLRAAQRLQSSQRRHVLESQLQAMQARIEPQFLFNTLARTRELYETDATLGDQMMDDLIVYLRAAMPLMRHSASTLRQEIELAHAYLNIVKIGLCNGAALRIDLPDNLANARFPPMMLLPLIDHAIAQRPAADAPRRTTSIAAWLTGECLQVRVTDSDAGFTPHDGDDRIANIRSRLDTLYGNEGSIVLRGTPDGASDATLVIPYEALA